MPVDSQFEPRRRSRRWWRSLCLGTWAVAVVVCVFELWPRIEGAWRRTPMGRVEPWSGNVDQFLDLGVDVAVEDLFGTAPRVKLDPRRMDRSRTLLWFRDRLGGGLETRNSWPNAVLASALVEAGEGGRAAVERFWDEILRQDGGLREEPLLLSHCMVGMPLLEWHGRHGDERCLAAAGRLVDWLLETHPKSSSGTLPYRPEEPDILLVDTLGMVCPLLVRFGSGQGRPEAVALAKRQLQEFLEQGMDPATGLPRHAYVLEDDGTSRAIGLGGWGRGVGWLALGLAGTIPWLPADDPDRATFEAALGELGRAAAVFQREDGLFGWALDIPGADPDTSATGMIAWAIRDGLACGALDAGEFVPLRDQALAGILAQTDESGRVGQSMADAAGVGRYPWLFDHTPWTQGFALLAARPRNPITPRPRY